MRVLKLITEIVSYANKKTKIFYLSWFFSSILALNSLLNTILFAAIINIFENEIMFVNIIYLLILYIIYKVVFSLIHSLQKYTIVLLRQKIDIIIRNDIINALDHISPECFEDNDWFEKKLMRASRIVGCVSDEIIAIGGLISIIISFISYCLYLSEYSVLMLVFGIIAAVLSITKSIITQKSLYNQSVHSSHLSTKYDRLYGDYFQINASLEMRTFAAFDFVESIRQKRLMDIFQYKKTSKIKNSAISTCFLVLRFILSLGMISYLLFHINASFGIVIAIIPYTVSIMSQLEDISMTVLSVCFSAKEWGEIKSFTDNTYFKNNDSPKNCLVNNSITCNEVCFSYPNGFEVIHNISLDIKKGETVAFVGENGCGKSTLLKILANIYMPTSGSVERNILSGEYKNCSDERNFGFIFQDIIHYPLPLLENIAPLNFDTDKIKLLAEKVGLDINKYDDPAKILYHGFVESINISGGEWQKLAIIRLLYYYENAEVYFFDEPTSALDPISEVEIFNLFRKFAKEKTLVFATHRLGIAKEAQRIYVMKNGSIIDSGDHDTLMSRCYLYRDMYRSQAEWYEGGAK